MKIFNLYEISEVKVTDPALQSYINIDGKLVLKNHGRNTEKFGRAKINIIERFVGLIGVPGHRGKKHRLMRSTASGKYNKNMSTMLETLKIIQEKTKENPIQVLIKAVENAAACDEVTTIEYGGARYPQAVDISPSRRITLALRNLVHGGSDKAFNKKVTIAEGLATELIASFNRSNESFAYTKRIEAEKQADASR